MLECHCFPCLLIVNITCSSWGLTCPEWGHGTPFSAFFLPCPFTSSSFAPFTFSPFPFLVRLTYFLLLSIPSFSTRIVTTPFSCVVAVVAWRVKKAVVAETPAHKQGHSLVMKTEQRRRMMKMGPTDTVVAESPLKYPQDSTIPSSLPTSHFMRRSSFYSEKPSRSFSKYAKLEERMTQKMLSPPSQKFDSTYVAGSWLTSPRRITPKALFQSLLSSPPSDKTSSNLPRKLRLKSPVTAAAPSTSQNFNSPVIEVGSSASAAVVASPIRTAVSSLSQLGMDSPSRNTRSHASAGKQGSQSEAAGTHRPDTSALPSSLGRRYNRMMSQPHAAVTSPDAKPQPQRFADEPQSLVAESSDYFPRSCETANQTAAYLPAGDKGSGEAPDKSSSKKKRYSVSQSDPHLVQYTAMSRKRKKLSKDVTCNLSPRKRPCRQLYLDFDSPTGKKGLSTVAADVADNEQSEESAVLTTLFGCDSESHVDTHNCAVLGQVQKPNSDILRHLGSSGVESESSSNDADLMITRKYQLDRKRSSGFQSLGHISETEYCPSPVFPSISNEPAAGPSDQNYRRTACDSVSTSPVFGKRKSQSCAGESPCFLLSGSGHKRTPVSGCAKSFSPDVSQCSIAHLMTSPLLGSSETANKCSRNQSSTRRCLDQQMSQTNLHSSVSQHSSSKSTNEDI